jgi:hypothetical protein
MGYATMRPAETPGVGTALPEETPGVLTLDQKHAHNVKEFYETHNPGKLKDPAFLSTTLKKYR